ncbi:helix-turn-helix domain-containing protein [Sporosarcina sp. FSL K6-1508]|uniref:helix-turn-helix domain-containing protein n=1 Tax=Sporosarcina sp. FSL K6-1508 TaxID=2921553 RepID=UPI0030F52D8A
MKVHEKVRGLRESKGISQTFVANSIGITVSGYNMKEHGKRPISIEELEKIAVVLEVQASYFFEKEVHVK